MKKFLFILIAFLSLISTAHAQETWYEFFNHIGWPMILYIIPGFLLLLFPVSLIKSWVYKHYLPKKSFKKIFWPVILASLFSTLLGIPIVWAFFFLIKLISKLLVLNKESFDLPKYILGSNVESQLLSPLEMVLPYIQWLISISIIFLVIPFYFVSSKLEEIILKQFKTFSHTSSIKKITKKANLASYLFLLVLGLIAIAWLFFVAHKIHINL